MKAHLKAKWATCSASVIADELNVTRNAVIGAVRRLGLPRKAKKPPAARKRRAKVVEPKKAVEPPEPLEDLMQPLMAFMDLKAGDCRWPVGNTKLFCGLGVLEGFSYCQRHVILAYRRDRQ